MTEKYRACSERLRQLRQQFGWTMRELAEISNVSLSTINRLENGKRGYAHTIEELAKVYEVDPVELVRG